MNTKRYKPGLIAVALTALLISSSCNKDLSIELPAPAPIEQEALFAPGKLVNSDAPQDITTTIYADGEVTLKLTMPPSTQPQIVEYTEEALAAIIKKYSVFTKGFYPYKALPADHYTVVLDPAGENATETSVRVNVTGAQRLDYGYYLAPISIRVGDEVTTHFVLLSKTGEFTPLLPSDPKALPDPIYGGPQRTEPIKMVAYVETNDWDPRNMGNFLLEESGKPVFDIVVLFAANMNFNAVTGKRYLFFNKELQPIVNNPDVYLKPLQDKGIKVIADILPNHQGVGYDNFQSYEEAVEFAKDCKEWADKSGLDGFDIDEEYANYGAAPHLPVIDRGKSWSWFARAMKEVMPDKLLTLYDYVVHFTPNKADEHGKYPKDYVDYSWTDYGWSSPSAAGLPNHRHGIRSIQANYGGLYRSGDAARAVVRGGYGLLMVFNINGNLVQDSRTADQISQATQVFYGENTVITGPYYPGPRDR